MCVFVGWDRSDFGPDEDWKEKKKKLSKGEEEIK
jgi:hypothetical protein